MSRALVDIRLGRDNIMVPCLDGYTRWVPKDHIDALREEFSKPAPESKSLNQRYTGPRVKLPNGAVIKLARHPNPLEPFNPVDIGYVVLRAPTHAYSEFDMDEWYKPGHVKPDGVVEIWDTADEPIPESLEGSLPVRWPDFSPRPARLVIEAVLLTLGINLRVKVTKYRKGCWHIARHGAWWNWEQKLEDIGGEKAVSRPPGRPLKRESKRQWETYRTGEVRYFENVSEASLRSNFAGWKRARRIAWKISFKTLADGRVWSKRQQVPDSVRDDLLDIGYSLEEIESTDNRAVRLRAAVEAQKRGIETRRRLAEEQRLAAAQERLKKELLG